jgi:hypothetical protein
MWQPWASLYLSGCKVHETRSWDTIYRGPLLIHASKKLVADCGEELDEIVCDRFGPHWRTDLPRGSIIGAVDLRLIVPTMLIRLTHTNAKTY